MHVAVQITLILCITLIVISVLGIIDKAIENKNKPKNIFEMMGFKNKEDKE